MRVLVVPHNNNFSLVEESLPSVQFTKTFLKNLTFKFVKQKVTVEYNNNDITNYDFVFLASFWKIRDIAYATSMYLTAQGIKHTQIEISGSKLTDQMTFTLNNIPSPNTFFINSKVPTKYIKDIEEICGYPLIIKDRKGRMGKNTFLIKDQKELIDQISKNKSHIRYLYQQYIPNNYDWGILISKGQVVAVEKSYPKKDEFRNNAYNGAKEIFLSVSECPESIKTIAKNAAKAIGLDWCRVDLIVDKNTNKPYVLEVNRFPGMTKGTDEVTASVDYIRDCLQQIV